MKKLILFSTPLFMLSLLILLTISCSDESGGTVVDPFGTGGVGGTGGNETVTITINSRQEQDGSTVFSGTPNVAIKVSKLTVSVPAAQYTEQFQFDGTTVVTANVSTDFLQYPANSGVASGQAWTFQIEGVTAAENKAFNVTSNYTIP